MKSTGDSLSGNDVAECKVKLASDFPAASHGKGRFQNVRQVVRHVKPKTWNMYISSNLYTVLPNNKLVNYT